MAFSGYALIHGVKPRRTKFPLAPAGGYSAIAAAGPIPKIRLLAIGAAFVVSLSAADQLARSDQHYAAAQTPWKSVAA